MIDTPLRAASDSTVVGSHEGDVVESLQRMSFDEFIEWHPDDGRQFELFGGVPVEMPNATGSHEDIGGFLSLKLGMFILASHPNWYVPGSATVKPIREEEGYKPDVVVLDRTQLENEPLWKKRSSILQGSSIPLIIEIVSTNWRDDYYRKLAEYEAMSIAEYWMVDYAALGGVRYIGKPKQPTITVCLLVDGEYELKLFRVGDKVESVILPEYELTVDEVFAVAG